MIHLYNGSRRIICGPPTYVQKAAAPLAGKHGCPATALDALQPALVRLEHAALERDRTFPDRGGLDVEDIRLGFWIELQRLATEVRS